MEIFNRLMSYAGIYCNQVSNPHISANEAIALADHVSLIVEDNKILQTRVEVLHNLIYRCKTEPDYYVVKTYDLSGEIDDKVYKRKELADKLKESRDSMFNLKTEVIPLTKL